jgi:hypothetical membrane protein
LLNRPLNRSMLIAGLIVAPFYLTLLITAGALEPGFSHLTMPMSMLGGVPGVRGLIFNVGVAVTGVFVIAFGIGLREHLPPKRCAKIGVGLLVIGGLGLVGAGYFHCNAGCRNILLEPDLVGRLHTIMSLLSGMGPGLAPFFIWAAMRHSEKWRGFATPTLVAAILANLPGVIFWITILTGFRLVSVEGLIQRIGFVVVLIWIFFTATKLWSMSRSGSEPER